MSTDKALFSNLTAGILSQVAGCPSILAEMALRTACIDFYENTWAWKEDLPEVHAADNSAVQMVTAPHGAACHAIDCLKSDRDLPSYAFQPPRILTFARSLGEGITFVAHAVLKPAHDA